MNETVTIKQEGVRAVAKYLWLSPSKVRRVAQHLRYRPVSDAVGILQHISHRSAVSLSKVIRSATANFLQRDSSINEKDIMITSLLVDEGPRTKRLWRRGRGRADILLKRMCHITVYVDLKQNFMQRNKAESVVKALKSSTTTAIRPTTGTPSSKEGRTAPDGTSVGGANESSRTATSSPSKTIPPKSQSVSSQTNKRFKTKKGTATKSN